MIGNEELGPCCGCGTMDGVTNIVMLSRRGAIGKGWGCLVCGLPADGAIAVLCDACVGQEPKFVCAGYPTDPARIAVSDLPPGVFDHDESMHEERA